MAAASASAFAAAMAQEFIDLAAGRKAEQETVEPAWATPCTVPLDLDCVRLRGFGAATEGVATLICAPFALHSAAITDIAPGHSLVATLQAAARGPVFVTDWRSADADMCSRSIDDYIADLNVLIDELGGAVDLIGLCQGGWMGLVYAARFPRKVRKLVLAGAPIDIAAGESSLSHLAQSTPMAVFKELVALGGGRMLGHHLLRFWEPKSFDAETIHILLESSDAPDTPAFHCLELAFANGTHGPWICRAAIISKWLSGSIWTTSLQPGASPPSADGSTCRASSCRSICWWRATITWLRRPRCWRWSGWLGRPPPQSVAPSRPAGTWGFSWVREHWRRTGSKSGIGSTGRNRAFLTPHSVRLFAP